MKQIRWIALLSVALCLLLCGMASAENQYYYVEVPVEISGNEVYTAVIHAGILKQRRRSIAPNSGSS